MLREVQRNEMNNIPKRKYKIWLSLFLIFFVMFILLYENFHITNYEVEGSKHYTKDEIIKKVVNSQLDKNSIMLYLKYKYLKQEKIPFIETIDIELMNKNSVKLQVYEKSIIGCIELMNEYMYFDKDGIIVETSVSKLEDVPNVTGIDSDHIVLHEKIATENEKLFQTILDLTQLIKKYKLEIDKINFNKNQEVILFSGDIRILLGKYDAYDEQLSELKNILPKAKGLKGYFDLRKFSEGQDKMIFNKDTH